MRTIPPDIYERVHELATAIANAMQAGDGVLYDSLCLTLRDYYDEQNHLGRSHPFLTEAMADFTTDPAESIRLYRVALEQARQFPDEPTHTKMLSLARQLIGSGHTEQAEAFLRDSRAEAVRCGDTFWVKDADELSKKLAN